MKQLTISLFQGWTKQLLLIGTFVLLAMLGYLCLLILNNVNLAHTQSKLFLASVLFAFLLTTIMAWFGSRIFCAAFVGPVACAFSILVSWAVEDPSYLFFVIAQILLCALLFFLDQRATKILPVFPERQESANF